MAYERLTSSTRMISTPVHYRIPINKDTDLRLVGDAIVGEAVDRLGAYEDLGMSPQELAVLIQKDRCFPGK